MLEIKWYMYHLRKERNLYTFVKFHSILRIDKNRRRWHFIEQWKIIIHRVIYFCSILSNQHFQLIRQIFLFRGFFSTVYHNVLQDSRICPVPEPHKGVIEGSLSAYLPGMKLTEISTASLESQPIQACWLERKLFKETSNSIVDPCK